MRAEWNRGMCYDGLMSVSRRGCAGRAGLSDHDFWRGHDPAETLPGAFYPAAPERASSSVPRGCPDGPHADVSRPACYRPGPRSHRFRQVTPRRTPPWLRSTPMRILQNLPRAGYRGGAFVALAIAAATVAARAEDPKDKDKAKAAPVAKVSYDKQVRPDLPGPLPGLPPAGQGRRRLRDDGVRAGCSRGASRGMPAIVPGKPDESHLIEHDHARRTARPRCPRTSRRWPRPRST